MVDESSGSRDQDVDLTDATLGVAARASGSTLCSRPAWSPLRCLPVHISDQHTLLVREGVLTRGDADLPKAPINSFLELVIEFKPTHPETCTLQVRLERLAHLTDKVSSREQYQGAKPRHDPVLQGLESSPSERAQSAKRVRIRAHLHDRDDVAQRLSASRRSRHADISRRMERFVQRGRLGGRRQQQGQNRGLDC